MSYNDEEDFENALEAYEEDDDEPIPLPCKTDGCNGRMMDFYDGMYNCPICGRTVSDFNAMKYLRSI